MRLFYSILRFFLNQYINSHFLSLPHSNTYYTPIQRYMSIYTFTIYICVWEKMEVFDYTNLLSFWLWTSLKVTFDQEFHLYSRELIDYWLPFTIDKYSAMLANWLMDKLTIDWQIDQIAFHWEKEEALKIIITRASNWFLLINLKRAPKIYVLSISNHEA